MQNLNTGRVEEETLSTGTHCNTAAMCDRADATISIGSAGSGATKVA